MNNLLFIPIPQAEESPTSVLKRMAFKHGCFYGREIFKILDTTSISSAPICQDNPAIMRMAEEAGPLRGLVLNGFYPPAPDEVVSSSLLINGIKVPRKYIRARNNAFCSNCWKEGKEHFIKDIKISTFCPFHHAQYILICPRCKKSIKWWKPIEDKCQCGCILKSQSCDPAETIIEQFLLNIFRTRDQEKFDAFLQILKPITNSFACDWQCSTGRAILGIAIGVINECQSLTEENLEKFRSLYPDIPARVLFAKFSRIPQPMMQKSVLRVLRHHRSEDNTTLQSTKHSLNAKRGKSSEFRLISSQLRAWLKIPMPHWFAFVSSVVKISDRGPYTWRQALAISDAALKFRLNMGKLKASPTLPLHLSRSETMQKLCISLKMLREILNEGLLTGLRTPTSQLVITTESVSRFDDNLMSIELLAANHNLTTSRIFKARAALGISPPSCRSRLLQEKLIHRKEHSAIIAYCNSSPTLPPIRTLNLPMISDSPTETWLTVTEGASYMGRSRMVIRSLVSKGLLKGAYTFKTKNGFSVSKESIDTFLDKHFNSRDAANLLGCAINRQSSKAAELNIVPVCSPEIDGTPCIFYSKDSFKSLQNKPAKGAIIEHENGLTITETAKLLHIDSAAIASMANRNLLKSVYHLTLKRRLITSSSVNEFYDHYVRAATLADWLGVSPSRIVKALSQLGIAPITGSPVDISRSRLYSTKSLTNSPFFIRYTSPETNPPSAKRRAGLEYTFKLNLHSLGNVIKPHNISPLALHNLFIKPGIIKIITINKLKFITPSDKNKIDEIFSNYYTCPQANLILKPRSAEALIKTGKLIARYPLSSATATPLLSKKDVHDYIKSLKSSAND
ncbi:hypothetical protein [Pseudomonas taiwanensis]|uniref:TniQ protein n=1 Tax=Pseudomonas taiwanensis TaxID=470150 RepID=A0ABR6V5P9_9PSED|nr:hypothetical protein [Pseudomonas taiwanensis]MBC3475771.1 hypothetical protein [Pseudomonas taiwanensis]